jgi:hypothetical protein
MEFPRNLSNELLTLGLENVSFQTFSLFHFFTFYLAVVAVKVIGGSPTPVIVLPSTVPSNFTSIACP